MCSEKEIKDGCAAKHICTKFHVITESPCDNIVKHKCYSCSRKYCDEHVMVCDNCEEHNCRSCVTNDYGKNLCETCRQMMNKEEGKIKETSSRRCDNPICDRLGENGCKECDAMYCDYHCSDYSEPYMTKCHGCDLYMCYDKCSTNIKYKYYCSTCADKILSNNSDCTVDECYNHHNINLQCTICKDKYCLEHWARVTDCAKCNGRICSKIECRNRLNDQVVCTKCYDLHKDNVSIGSDYTCGENHCTKCDHYRGYCSGYQSHMCYKCKTEHNKAVQCRNCVIKLQQIDNTKPTVDSETTDSKPTVDTKPTVDSETTDNKEIICAHCDKSVTNIKINYSKDYYHPQCTILCEGCNDKSIPLKVVANGKNCCHNCSLFRCDDCMLHMECCDIKLCKGCITSNNRDTGNVKCQCNYTCDICNLDKNYSECSNIKLLVDNKCKYLMRRICSDCADQISDLYQQ